MSSPVPAPQYFPEATSVQVVSLESLQDSVLRQARDYWRMVRGTRKFPAREDIKPRDISMALNHMVLARIVDRGADLELKIVGDEVSRAYGAPMNGRRISEIAQQLPKAAERWKQIQRLVADTRTPIAMSVTVGLDAPEVNYTHAEVVCFPLGPSDNVVDHLLVFGRHDMRIV